MKYLKALRRAGWICFVLMWIPFTLMFIGMIGMPSGSYAWSELPLLSRVSMTAMVILAGSSTILLFGPMIIGLFWNRRIQEEGQPALAKILEIHDTGTTVNQNPLVRLVLEVHPENAAPFTAETEQLISRLGIPQIQPGAEVLVKFDPESGEVALID